MSDVAHTPLTDLLHLAPIGSVDHVSGGAELTVGGADRETAARMLAEDAMALRCGESPILDRWRERRDGGPPMVGTAAKAVGIYASLGFGSPASPANETHLQGLVAELLWNRLLKERLKCADGRELVHAHSVKPDPLEPGGDGLVIYRAKNDSLVFRLWEIKKHDSSAKVSSTIRRASRQLKGRGHEYIAKLAGPETIEQEGPLGAFYADLVELWLDGGPRAGVGVSVGTSVQHAPKGNKSFASMSKNFPDFKEAGQLEGMVVALPDFPEFARRVREVVWSGL